MLLLSNVSGYQFNVGGFFHIPLHLIKFKKFMFFLIHFFCYRLNRLVGTKKHLWNIHIDRICIQHETHVWLKNFLVKETLPEQVGFLNFFLYFYLWRIRVVEIILISEAKSKCFPFTPLVEIKLILFYLVLIFLSA